MRVSTGKVRHSTEAEVQATMRDEVPTLSASDAAAIASWYQGPSAADMPFTTLASGLSVDYDDIYDATMREFDKAVRMHYRDEAAQLSALLRWLEDNATGYDLDIPLGSASGAERSRLVALAEKYADNPARPACDADTTLRDWVDSGLWSE